MIFIEIQPLYCFWGKMCRKLEKWDPLMGSHPVRETRLCIYRPCLLTTLGRRQIGASRIFSHNFPQKNSGWGGGGGGVYYTRPSLPISIKYKQEGVRIRVKLPSRYKTRLHAPLASPPVKLVKMPIRVVALAFDLCFLYIATGVLNVPLHWIHKQKGGLLVCQWTVFGWNVLSTFGCGLSQTSFDKA